jgi:hypothetical protein
MQAAVSEKAFRRADRDNRVKLLVRILDEDGYGQISRDTKTKIAQDYLDTDEGRSPMPDRERDSLPKAPQLLRIRPPHATRTF